MLQSYIPFVIYMMLGITCLALIVLGVMTKGLVSRRRLTYGIIAVLLVQTIVVMVFYYHGVPLR